MKKLIPFAIFLLLFSGCRKRESGEIMAMSMSGISSEVMVPPPPPESGGKAEQPKESYLKSVQPQKIIKDGSFQLESKNPEIVKTRIDSIVKSFGGYYASEKTDSWGEQLSYELKIRIPSIRFDEFVSALAKGNGTIVNREITAEDVTEEYIDLETRIALKKKYLERSNELLKKAKEIGEIVSIEDQSRRLEEEIETTEGKLKYLNNRLDFSTIDLKITPIFISRRPGWIEDIMFKAEFRQSLINGLRGIIYLFLFLVKLWPLWLIVAILLLVIIRLKRRNRVKERRNSPAGK